MRLLFIDAGRKCGYAFGEAGSIPTSGTVVLRKPGDDPALGIGALARWLRDHVRQHGKPDLLGVEHWLPIKASPNASSAEDSLRLNGCIHGLAGIYGLRTVQPFPATIRAVVCGQAHGKEEETKTMVLRTMILLGYLPKDCVDTDRSDAVCGWAWLEATFGRAAPANFVLTEGKR